MKTEKWQVFFENGNDSFSLNVLLKLKTRPFGKCEKCGMILPGMIINISITNIRDGIINTVNYPDGVVIDIKPISQGDPVIQKAIKITQEMFKHDHKYCFEHLSQAINKIIIQANQAKSYKPIILSK